MHITPRPDQRRDPQVGDPHSLNHQQHHQDQSRVLSREIQRQTDKETKERRNRLLRKTPSQNSPAQDIARDSSNRERRRRATPAQTAFKAFRNNRSEPFKMFDRPKASDT